jgi:hypothetical protein
VAEHLSKMDNVEARGGAVQRGVRREEDGLSEKSKGNGVSYVVVVSGAWMFVRSITVAFYAVEGAAAEELVSAFS